MALTDLQEIRTAVRQYAQIPSEAQMSEAQLDDFINRFVLYDFPSELRLFFLRTKLNFYTQPGVDTYETTYTDPLDPLYNFKNKYIAIHPQIFMAGVPASYTQDRNVFYGQWPQTNAVVNTGLSGNGTAGPFSGIVNSASQPSSPAALNQPQILQRSVIFTALDAVGTAMILVDTPYNNTSGYLAVPGAVPTSMVNNGTINYMTGLYTVTFPNTTAPSNGSIPNPIWVEYVPYVAGKPISMLFYNQIFTIRPVPDKAYLIQLEVDERPTELLVASETPQIEQWMEYIALGTTLRILLRRGDKDSYNMFKPQFIEEQNKVNRTSLEQATNMRSQTIYVTGLGNNWGWNGSNWPSY